MNSHDLSRIADAGHTSSLSAAELQALNLNDAMRSLSMSAGDPVAMQPGQPRPDEAEPGDPVPAQRPGDPVPAQRPGDPVPAQRPGDPVPAKRPCAQDTEGNPVACGGGRPR